MKKISGLKESLFLIIFLFFLTISASAQEKEEIVDEAKFQNVLVTQAMEGDTLRLENGECIRLIGVDTPENQMGGKLVFDSKVTLIQIDVLQTMAKEALRFTKQLVDGKMARIEFDEKKRDQYGMLLGYVFIKEKDKGKEIFVNAEIIKKGYSANVHTGPNNRYSQLLHDMYLEGDKNPPGIWSQWRR